MPLCSNAIKGWLDICLELFSPIEFDLRLYGFNGKKLEWRVWPQSQMVCQNHVIGDGQDFNDKFLGL